MRATNRNIEYFCAPKHIFAISYEDLYIKNIARLSCEMAQNAPGAQNAPNAHVCKNTVILLLLRKIINVVKMKLLKY